MYIYMYNTASQQHSVLRLKCTPTTLTLSDMRPRYGNSAAGGQLYLCRELCPTPRCGRLVESTLTQLTTTGGRDEASAEKHPQMSPTTLSWNGGSSPDGVGALSSSLLTASIQIKCIEQ